jgi:predicted phosphoadenosine phosphosulfate sulfurtransferase
MPIKYFFSYETLCGAVIRRDFVFKKYGFGYSNKMSKRIEEIQGKWNQEL